MTLLPFQLFEALSVVGERAVLVELLVEPVDTVRKTVDAFVEERGQVSGRSRLVGCVMRLFCNGILHQKSRVFSAIWFCCAFFEIRTTPALLSVAKSADSICIAPDDQRN